jgi:dienelactone hydrolase
MAAATLTLVKAAKNSITYSVAGATAETVDLTGAAAGITGMTAGPLKTLLTADYANQAAAALAFVGDAANPTTCAARNIRVSQYNELGSLACLVDVVGPGGKVKFTLTGTELAGAAGFLSYLTIEYRPSIAR